MPAVINAAYPIESLYAPVAGLREDAYGTFHTPDQLRPGQTYSVVSYIPDLSPQSLRGDETESVFADTSGAYQDFSTLSIAARSPKPRTTE